MPQEAVTIRDLARAYRQQAERLMQQSTASDIDQELARRYLTISEAMLIDLNRSGKAVR